MNNHGNGLILIVISIVILILTLAVCISDENQRMYECVDLQGKTHYVNYINRNNGNWWIRLEDGTMVRIIQYREILVEE